MPSAARVAETRIDQCLLELRGLILKGVYEPGERISELALAARLGVSRTPLRLALDRLAGEGLLEAGARGGFLVRRFELSDLWDAIELRGVLEGTAARFAAEGLEDDHELDTLRERASEIESLIPVTAADFARYLEWNEAFHAELKRLSKSRMLIDALDRVQALPFAAPRAQVFGSTERTAVERSSIIAQEHHRAIIEAISAREGTRAEAVTREHCRLARRNLARALEEGGAGAEVPGVGLIRLDGGPGCSTTSGRRRRPKRVNASQGVT